MCRAPRWELPLATLLASLFVAAPKLPALLTWLMEPVWGRDEVLAAAAAVPSAAAPASVPMLLVVCRALSSRSPLLVLGSECRSLLTALLLLAPAWWLCPTPQDLGVNLPRALCGGEQKTGTRWLSVGRILLTAAADSVSNSEQAVCLTDLHSAAKPTALLLPTCLIAVAAWVGLLLHGRASCLLLLLGCNNCVPINITTSAGVLLLV
jgi:hypothetical protein